jgi:hypothetical protein
MPKRKSASPTHRALSWRDYNDSLHRSFPAQPNPESLRPDSGTVINAISGSPEARAIVDAYAFRFPVRILAVLD